MAPKYILSATLYQPPRWVKWTGDHQIKLLVVALAIGAALVFLPLPLWVPILYFVLLLGLGLARTMAQANSTNVKVVLSDQIVLVKYPAQTLKFVLKDYSIQVYAEKPGTTLTLLNDQHRQTFAANIRSLPGGMRAKAAPKSVPKISKIVLKQQGQATTLPLLLWQHDYEGLQYLTRLWQAAGLPLTCRLLEKDGWQVQTHL